MKPSDNHDTSQGEQDNSPAQSNNSQKGQRKRKKADVGWREEPQGGLVVTKRVGELLSDLLTVYNHANHEHLDVLLTGLDPASLSMESGSSLATVVNRLVCAAEDDVSEVVKVLVKQDAELRLKELHRMVTLVQLALHVDRYVFCIPMLFTSINSSFRLHQFARGCCPQAQYSPDV